MEPSLKNVLTLAAILIQAGLAGILIRKWAKKQNASKLVLITFLVISCTILSLTLSGHGIEEHKKLGFLGASAALAAVSAIAAPVLRKWAVPVYALAAAAALVLPFDPLIRAVTAVLALASMLVSAYVYARTRNKNMLLFILGIILFTVTGLLTVLHVVSHDFNIIGVSIGVILWTIPFIRR